MLNAVMLNICSGNSTCEPVFDAVTNIRSKLPNETTFLGFCGAPWTVATYIIAGRGTPDQAPSRLFAYKHRHEFSKLLDLLADVSGDYLIKQLRSGADAVQIFDSWSGVLGNSDFDDWCIKPVKRIVDRVRAEIPDAKIIGFPKGSGFNYLDYRSKTGVDCVVLIGLFLITLQNKCKIRVPFRII